MPKYVEQMALEQLRRAELRSQDQSEEVRTSDGLGPVITISRQLGSGGRKVAERLAEILDWSLFDKELVEFMAKNASVRKKVVESFDERTISELEVLARSIMGEHEMGGFLYSKHLARVVLAIARHGNAIILGRGAGCILKDSLHVRIHASEEQRIENLMRFEGWTHEHALEQMRHSDRERAAFTWKMHRHDVTDCSFYDLVIKTDDFDIEGTARIIITALRFKHPKLQLPHGA